MVTPYTKAAALRLLPFAIQIEVIREYRNCIQITYKVKGGRRCSTFLSKKKFVSDFSTSRINSAAAVEVVEVHSGNKFVVKSGDKFYVVRPSHEDPYWRCECPDCYYRAAFCKHQIVVRDFNAKSLVEEVLPSTRDAYKVEIFHTARNKQYALNYLESKSEVIKNLLQMGFTDADIAAGTFIPMSDAEYEAEMAASIGF